LLFDANQSILFNPTSLIQMPGETLNMNGFNILNSSNLQSPSDSDITIEGQGTGDIVFNVPYTQTTPSMRVGDNGICYLNNIPSASVASTTTNNILRYNNFSSSAYISFFPIITGNSASPTQSGSGVYVRVGNLVWFRAVVTIIGAGSGVVGTDVIRLTIPVAVDYTTLNMPQAVSISYYTGININAIDLSMTIGGTGESGVPGGSIDFARMYARPNNTSSGLSPLVFNDLNLSNCTLRYSGVYYVF
jgi:hypothetical protein